MKGALAIDVPSELASLQAPVSVTIPLRSTVAFPDDGLGAPTPSTIWIESREGRANVPVPAPTASTVAQACAPKLAVGWGTIDGPSGDRYRVPSMISLTNAGPGLVLAGARIIVSFDSDVLSLVPASLPATGRAVTTPNDLTRQMSWKSFQGNRAQLELFLDHTLPQGRSAQIAIDATTIKSARDSGQYPVVTLDITSLDTAVRETGELSASPLSSGGLAPLTDTAAVLGN